MIKIIVGLFVQTQVIRYLEPARLGLLDYAVSLNSVFMILISLGFGNIVIRNIINNPKLTRFYLGTVAGIKLAGALIAFLVVNSIGFILNEPSELKIIVLLISFDSISRISTVFNMYFQAHVITKYQVIAHNIGFLISIGLRLLFIYLELDLVWFAFTFFIDFLISSIIKGVFYYRIRGDILKWRFSWKIGRSLLIDSLPIGITLFLTQIHTRVDVLMLKKFLGDTQTGLYSAANMISNYLALTPNILLAALIPYFINLKKTNEKFYRRRFIQVLTMVTWGSILIGAVLIIPGDILITSIFGEKYAASYHVLQFSIWKLVFVTQTVLINVWLINVNLQRFQLYTNLIGAILNIVLNYMLIFEYGVIGAAVATIITRIFIGWVSPFFFEPIRESAILSLRSLNPLNLIPGRKF